MTCPAYTYCQGVAVLSSSVFSMPYNGTIHYDGTGATTAVSGTYYGVKYYALSYTITTTAVAHWWLLNKNEVLSGN